MLPHSSLKRKIVPKKTKYIKGRNLNRKKIFVVCFVERTDTWWWKMLGPDVIDKCWRKNLTINMEGVFELAGLLEPIIWPKWNSPNYTTETKLAITLYYLKDPGSLWMTASTFGAHQSTVSKTASKVWKAINEILSPKFLHPPGTIEEMRETVSKFEVRFGTPQAFGCINGTDVPLKRPQDFLNYR